MSIKKEKEKRTKFPEHIIISSSKLELMLTEYQEKFAVKNNWNVPLGVFITLVVCLMVSDFKDKFGFKAMQWETTIFIAAILSVIWLVKELITIRNNKPLEELLTEIQENIKNIPEYTAVCFIKSNQENSPVVLVEDNLTWGCFFLPHVHYSPYEEIEEQKVKIKKAISGFLGIVNDNITIEHLKEHSLSSEKYSESEKINKQYNFEFFSFYISSPEDLKISDQKFDVRGKKFVWMSLDELESDKKTQQKNLDVIGHLRKNYNTFFVDIRDSIK